MNIREMALVSFEVEQSHLIVNLSSTVSTAKLLIHLDHRFPPLVLEFTCPAQYNFLSSNTLQDC